MKQTPEQQRVRSNMAPGVLSRDGFLGDDGRDLREILDADASAVTAAGASHERLAARLAMIVRAAQRALGTSVRVSEHLTALGGEAMGRVACPFGGCGLFAKGDVELTDARTGRVLRITPLSVHLIARHGFYQGRGSRYRLEPTALAETLDIPAPGE